MQSRIRYRRRGYKFKQKDARSIPVTLNKSKRRGGALIWLLVAGGLSFIALAATANAQNRKSCNTQSDGKPGKCGISKTVIFKKQLLGGLIPAGDTTSIRPAPVADIPLRPSPQPAPPLKTNPGKNTAKIKTRLITGLINDQNLPPETKPGKPAIPERTRSARRAVIVKKLKNQQTPSLKKKLMTGLIVPAMVAPGRLSASKNGANTAKTANITITLKKKMVSGLISPVLPLPETGPLADKTPAPAATADIAADLKKKINTGFIGTNPAIPVAGLQIGNRLTTGSITRDYNKTRSKYLRNNGPMNLAEIVAKTILDNPEISIARARKKDSKAGVGVARAALFPNIDLAASIGKENTYLKTVTTRGILRQEASITIKQNLFDFGKTSSDIARSRALLASAKYRLVDKTDEIVLAIAAAYLDVLEARQFVGVARKNVVSHKKLFKLVKTNEAGGNATSADTKRVTSRLESAQTALIDVGSKLQAAKEEFRKITGLYPGRLAPPPSFSNRAFSNNDAEIEARLMENPILLSIQQDIISLRKQLASARRSLLPALTFEGYGNSKKNISGINPRARDFRGMLKISYKLFDGGAKRYGMEQLRARIEENEMRYAKMRQDLLQEYKNSAQSANASNSKAVSLNSRLKASKKVMSLYIEQFKAGKRTVFELLDAQMDLFNAQSEQISNRYEHLRTTYKKLRLNGKLVQTILGYSAD